MCGDGEAHANTGHMQQANEAPHTKHKLQAVLTTPICTVVVCGGGEAHTNAGHVQHASRALRTKRGLQAVLGRVPDCTVLAAASSMPQWGHVEERFAARAVI